ncbi:MAG: nicotinate phosphoribosyltransferase [Desulfobacterales bacterium]|nr:nicotinate phosphoribosyltransferase [Desulfobacterales bacterium]
MEARHRVGALFTDLYELTMAAGYWAHGLYDRATFSVFIRGGGTRRDYFVAVGLEDVVTELEAFSFLPEEIAFLETTGRFSSGFLDYLGGLRFTGDMVAMAEGTVFFADEPILEITAPLIEAQILETFILNTLGFQTMIATKAARCIKAAGGRPLIDFSLRRTQGTDAGMKVARSTWIAGFDATSNVLAGKQYGLPLSGTMAHSFVTAFDTEMEAFSAYAQTFPESTVLLIDTYDVIQGARNAVTVAQALRNGGNALVGVRLDSGDMASQSINVRRILDQGGFPEVKIFASSGFDEFKIADVIDRGARIDAFGVGTKVGVSSDAPFLNIVYKLVRYAGRNVRKTSPGKATLGGEKQVFRQLDKGGAFVGDIVGTRHEHHEGAESMLTPVMVNGSPVGARPRLSEIRARFQTQISMLGHEHARLDGPVRYPIRISEGLNAVQPL